MKCSFYEVKPTNVNKIDQFHAKIVVGMQNLHQVCSVGLNKFLLQTWNLSCFCKFCTNGGDGPCDHIKYVPKYDFIRLVPCRPKDVINELDEHNILINNDQEMLVATLNVGDHFIVIVATCSHCYKG